MKIILHLLGKKNYDNESSRTLHNFFFICRSQIIFFPADFCIFKEYIIQNIFKPDLTILKCIYSYTILDNFVLECPCLSDDHTICMVMSFSSNWTITKPDGWLCYKNNKVFSVHWLKPEVAPEVGRLSPPPVSKDFSKQSLLTSLGRDAKVYYDFI